MRPVEQGVLLLAGEAVAAGLWWAFTRREVRLNAAAIRADGSADTLHEGFHARRTWVRLLWWGALATAGVLPGWGHWAALPWAWAALACLLGAYFVRTFTPTLSFDRARPEGRFYVSFAARAAGWPDSWLARAARRRHPADEAAARRWAQARLQLVLNALLAAGVLLTLALGWQAVQHW